MGPQYWSNAATLMLAARFRNVGQNVSKPVKYMLTNINNTVDKTNKLDVNWRELNDEFDYKILLLKRSSKSSFMKNAFVFPGGRTSGVDQSISSWEKVFKTVLQPNIDSKSIYKLLNSLTTKAMPLMYMFPDEASKMANIGVKYIEVKETYTHYNKLSTNTDIEAMWGAIQHRLSAIRETFEEAGILLYTDRNSVLSSINNSEVAVKPKSISKTDLDMWREKVNKDSNAFMEMFIELGEFF